MTRSTICISTLVAALGLTITSVTAIIELDFRVTPSIVKPLETSDVTLQCIVTSKEYYNPDTNRDIKYFYPKYLPAANPTPRKMDNLNIAIIRVLKNFQDKWKPIVQISNVAPNYVYKLETSINRTDGVISDDPVKNSFVQVIWDVATADVYGVYRCDVISFDKDENAVLTTSSKITLGSDLDSLALLRVLKHEASGILDRVQELENDLKENQNLTEQVKTDLETLEEESGNKQTDIERTVKQQQELLKSQGDQIQTRIGNLEREITKKIDEISGQIQVVIDSGFFMLWPRGSFGLLKPKSGCPSSGLTTWDTGSRKHHTESTDRNQDSVSPEIHLQEPVLERVAGNNFVTQHFCIRPDAHSLGPAWPRGSYCINKKDDCPFMFEEGFLKWDEENDSKLGTIEGELPDGESKDGIARIEYCCRQDGPADIPIYLPSSDPFYLYRYGGTCQSVQGMNVTEEFLLFDTENFENKDELGQIHPDGKINNVRLELCYYTKK